MYAVLETKRQDEAVYTCPHCSGEFSASDVEVRDNVVYFDSTEEMYSQIAYVLGVHPAVVYQEEEDEDYIFVETGTWEVGPTTLDLSKLGRVQTIWYCGDGCFVDGDDDSPPDPEEPGETWEVWKCGQCNTTYDGEAYGLNATAAQLARGCCG